VWTSSLSKRGMRKIPRKHTQRGIELWRVLLYSIGRSVHYGDTGERRRLSRLLRLSASTTGTDQFLDYSNDPAEPMVENPIPPCPSSARTSPGGESAHTRGTDLALNRIVISFLPCEHASR